MALKYTAQKGTQDVMPTDSYRWSFVENLMKDIAKNYGYREVRTPTFEATELFARGVGDTSDVVQKEMYTFNDKGDRSITLKPEGTAGAVRAAIESGQINDALPFKACYVTPCFRYDKPQAGRFREFHQFGIEAIGSDTPSLDAEVIELAMQYLKEIGLDNLSVSLNSVGCPVCRKAYNEKLKKYLEAKSDKLCDLCNERREKNPMRVIDCKNETCQENIEDIPLIADNLCSDCQEHFEILKKYLDEMNISYEIDKKIVRGLDYYKRTAFEIIANGLGSQSTVCGGGRYDGLVEDIGGPAGNSGIGFAMGAERLLLTLDANNVEIERPDTRDIFIVTIGDSAKLKSFAILKELRDNNISADKDHLD